jgi:hypothetical protein
MNLIIKDLDNNAIYFESDSVLRIKWTSPRNGILKINYAEPEFAVISGSVLNCIDFEEGTDYNIKKISEENHVFLKKAGKFFAENDYNGIKTILSFPSTNELGFRLKDSDGNSLAEANMDKDVSTSIYVREVPVQYIDDYGNINAGLLELKIW